MDNHEITYQLDLAAADLDRTTDTFNAILNGMEHEIDACANAQITAASMSDFIRIYREGLSFVLCH